MLVKTSHKHIKAAHSVKKVPCSIISQLSSLTKREFHILLVLVSLGSKKEYIKNQKNEEKKIQMITKPSYLIKGLNTSLYLQCCSNFYLKKVKEQTN